MTGEKKTEILLVEDSPSDVTLMLRALKSKNLENKVHVVTDGAQALDFIFCTGAYSDRDIKTPPKVIFLDLNLPKVDGREVLRRVKADERTQSIPVVIMTSSQEESDLVAGYKLGANSYVVKPIDFEKFGTITANLGYYWVFVNKSLPL